MILGLIIGAIWASPEMGMFQRSLDMFHGSRGASDTERAGRMPKSRRVVIAFIAYLALGVLLDRVFPVVNVAWAGAYTAFPIVVLAWLDFVRGWGSR